MEITILSAGVRVKVREKALVTTKDEDIFEGVVSAVEISKVS